MKASDFAENKHNDWCPGCGDFGILRAVQMALAEQEIAPYQTAVISGVGCSGKTPHFIKAYGVHSLHGRALPYATGVKLANPELQVIIVGGDGDGLGIGAAHFVNSGRRNLDICYIIFDNAVYGLTKGQASPTLKLGEQPKSLPTPNINEAVNPLWLALASGATFVGRGYSFDIKHLRDLLVRGMRHRGYAFIDVLQPCPTYNDLHTKDWYAGKDKEEVRPRVQPLPEDFDPRLNADSSEENVLDHARQFMVEAHRWGNEIPTGLFLENTGVNSFAERIRERVKSYAEQPPAHKVIAGENGMANADLTSMFDELAVN